MLGRRDAPFPTPACRDLLGLVRAMYAATPRRDLARRRSLARIGKMLVQALDLMIEAGPGTIGERAAWNWAEKACAELGQVVTVLDQLEPTAIAATSRITGAVKREYGKKRDER